MLSVQESIPFSVEMTLLWRDTIKVKVNWSELLDFLFLFLFFNFCFVSYPPQPHLHLIQFENKRENTSEAQKGLSPAGVLWGPGLQGLLHGMKGWRRCDGQDGAEDSSELLCSISQPVMCCTSSSTHTYLSSLGRKCAEPLQQWAVWCPGAFVKLVKKSNLRLDLKC